MPALSIDGHTVGQRGLGGEVVCCYGPAGGAGARRLPLLLPEALAAAQPLAALHCSLVLRQDPPDALLKEGRQTQGHAVDLEAGEISQPLIWKIENTGVMVFLEGF